MRRIIGDIHAGLQFLRTGLRDLDKNASLLPSSQFLVDAMLEAVPLEKARCVVELGPGVGTVTRSILERIGPDAHLHAIELDRALLHTMRKQLRDRRLRPIHGSAVRTAELVRRDGCAHQADAVMSSLGLSMMDEQTRSAVMESAVRLLPPSGRFVQYAYLHARALTYSRELGWYGFDARRFLQRYFRHVTGRVVMLNAPPAMVFSCELPIQPRVEVTDRLASSGT